MQGVKRQIKFYLIINQINYVYLCLKRYLLQCEVDKL